MNEMNVIIKITVIHHLFNQHALCAHHELGSL